MEIALLTAFLAPFLEALMKAGGSTLSAAAERGGTEAADHAQRLWSRIRGKAAEQPEVEDAARKLADRPQSARRQRALSEQLEALLADDDDLASEVAGLWEQANAAGVVAVASGDRSVAVAGEVSGSIFITGDDVSVEQ